MEDECKLLSSRGILKSCCMHSRNPTSDLTKEITYAVDKKNISLRKTPSVYVNTAALEFFCRTILPKIKAPIVLVTGDSDNSLPNRSMNLDFIARLLSHPKIKRWYCQNLCCRVQNLHALPIGLDYHTLSTRDAFGQNMKQPIDQETSLKDISRLRRPFWERQVKCYTNFAYSMRHSSGEPIEYADIRKAALSYVNSDLYDIEKKSASREECWRNQLDYAFVISPPGNGLDCHRTWEALNLGCIPIILRPNFSGAHEQWQLDVYDELPVLVVGLWEDITQTLLDDTVRRFESTRFNYDKLSLKYWLDKIHE